MQVRHLTLLVLSHTEDGSEDMGESQTRVLWALNGDLLFSRTRNQSFRCSFQEECGEPCGLLVKEPTETLPGSQVACSGCSISTCYDLQQGPAV